MNVTYDYYRIFYYVGKYGSFTKAAQMIGSSQPNITRSMNNLESQLDVKLFQRTQKGIKLTKEGENLHKKVSVAFEQIKSAEAEIEAIRNHEVGICTIGVSDIALSEVLVPTLPRIIKEFPKISVKITNESSVSAVSKIREGIIDFALITTPVQNSISVKSVDLKEINEIAAVSKDYDISTERAFSLRVLSKQPIITLAHGTATRAFYDQLFAKQGIELNPQMVAGTVNQVVSMVKAGLGVGFVPSSFVEGDEAVKILTLKDVIPKRKVCLVYDKDRPLSDTASTIISCIINDIAI